MKTYSCIVCGGEFPPLHQDQKYCSLRCKNRADKNDRRFGGIREYVIERDKFKCTVCGSQSGLIVHHKDWVRTNNIPENLTTLCRSCHKKEHFEVTVTDQIGKCLICGEDFSPMESKRNSQVLCRRKECAAKYKAIQKRTQHEQVPCKICGALFMQKHSRHLCCSEKCTLENNDRLKAALYARNREEVIGRQKRYYQETKEERLVYIKKWQSENVERVKETKRRSAIKNREKRNARSRERYKLTALPLSQSG